MVRWRRRDCLAASHSPYSIDKKRKARPVKRAGFLTHEILLVSRPLHRRGGWSHRGRARNGRGGGIRFLLLDADASAQQGDTGEGGNQGGGGVGFNRFHMRYGH